MICGEIKKYPEFYLAMLSQLLKEREKNGFHLEISPLLPPFTQTEVFFLLK